MDLLRKDYIKILLKNKSDPNIPLFIQTHKEWNKMNKSLDTPTIKTFLYLCSIIKR
jgi:hypothetical protein